MTNRLGPNMLTIATIAALAIAVQCAHASDRFVGPIKDIQCRPDGTGICVTARAIYLSDRSDRDMSVWKCVWIAPKDGLYPILILGCGRGRTLLLGPAPEEQISVLEYPDNGNLKSISVVPFGGIAFASERVGVNVIFESGLAAFTFDGGKTWSTPVSLPEKDKVPSMAWISETGLIVGTEDGTIRRIDIAAENARIVTKTQWSKSLGKDSITSIGVGPDRIGVMTGESIALLNNADGQVLGSAHVENSGEIVMLGGDILLTDHTGIQRWSLDGKEFFLRGEFARSVGKVFPITPDLVWVEMGGNTFMRWDRKSERPRDMKLTVDNSLFPEDQRPENTDQTVSAEDLVAAIELSPQLPADVAETILNEAASHKDWSPKKQMKWQVEQYRKYLADHGGAKK